MDLKTMLSEVKARKRLTKNIISVGVLSNEIIDFLLEKEVAIHTKDIFINHRGLGHLSREHKKSRGAGLSKEDIKIPDILRNPSHIYFETAEDKYNVIFCSNFGKNCIKIVVDTKFILKGKKLSLIKTAGYVQINNMKGESFEKIK